VPVVVRDGRTDPQVVGDLAKAIDLKYLSPACRATKLTVRKDEYKDESGRIRTCKHLETPRNLVLNQEDEIDEDEYVNNLSANCFGCL